MFIGREKELQFLNEKYSSNKAEFIVMYGRRRIGKTETLIEFSKDKFCVFYSCKENLIIVAPYLNGEKFCGKDTVTSE